MLKQMSRGSAPASKLWKESKRKHWSFACVLKTLHAFSTFFHDTTARAALRMQGADLQTDLHPVQLRDLKQGGPELSDRNEKRSQIRAKKHSYARRFQLRKRKLFNKWPEKPTPPPNKPHPRRSLGRTTLLPGN